MNRSRCALAVAVLSLATLGVADARAGDTTSCAVGGPTPGARVVRLDLPHGADDVSLQLRPSSATGKRTVQGLFLLSARTHRLVAYRIAADGSAPERNRVSAGGTDVVDEGNPA